MKRLIWIAGLFIFIVTGARAQTPADAATYFENSDYQLALEAYKALLAKKPKDATLYNYRCGYSAYMLGVPELATEYFEKSTSKFPMASYYLGEIYFNAYRFDDAVEALEDFLETVNSGNELEKTAEKRLVQAEQGARFIRRVEDVEIVDSVVVNKAYFLNHIRPAAEMGTLRLQSYYEDNKPLEGVVYTSQRGDRKYLSRPVNGNFELFTSSKLLDSWTDEVAVSELNTNANQNFPFLMSDGVTLYFASDNEESLGGYDIFISRLNSSTNQFLKPENIGMPFNSPYNDYMLVIDELNEVGWFVSDRFLPEGKVAVYQFIPRSETLVVKTDDTEKLIAKAQISNFKAQKGAFRYFDNDNDVKHSSASKQIFINDNRLYADEKSFVSNTARNFYFQADKLEQELQNARTTLDDLRLNYATASAADKTKLRSEILKLEKNLREGEPKLQLLQKNMRMEEMKTLNMQGK